MGIKGLTDRNMAFPEIGVIRKGAPKPQDGRVPGKDLTYFRVEFDDRELEAAAKFRKINGDEPREINIMLPFDDIDRVWDAWLEAYTAGRMVARSDGEKFIYLVDAKTGEVLVKNGQPFKRYEEGKPVGFYTNQKTKKDEAIYCKPTGRLKVVIPELQRLAYLVVLTTSYHDIANISAQLEALKQVNNGRLAGIPLILRRRPKKISTPKPDGSKARYTKWMLSIEADPSWVKKMLMEVKHLALPGNGLDLLPAGEDVIDAEFSNDEPVEDYQDDYEDEEEIPGEPEMEAEEQTTAESDFSSRPYSPEVVKAKVADRANTHEGKEANQSQRGLMVGTLDLCFAAGDAEMRRHQICTYLTGEASSKKMPANYVLAMLDWLKPEKQDTGEWIPDSMAAKEAQAILTAQIESTGQTKLL